LHSDPPQPVWLLRVRRGRRRSRRAAEQQNQLAPFQLIELHSIPASQGRTAEYRIGEDQSGGKRNDFTTCQPMALSVKNFSWRVSNAVA
jgi:hypothetical protein